MYVSVYACVYLFLKKENRKNKSETNKVDYLQKME